MNHGTNNQAGFARTPPMGVVALWCIAVAGCADPSGTPLIDVPAVQVTTATVARGMPVHLVVVNSTRSEVVLPPPVCATRLEQLSAGQWFEVPFPNPDCVGVEVSLAVGASHPFAFPTMPDRTGRFRAVVHGSNADGTFVVRSPTFVVE